MTAAKIYSLFFLILICGMASAQEELTAPSPESVEIPVAPPQPEVRQVRLPELEGLSLVELRKQFPRLPNIMVQINSWRIPDYGPMLNISLQLPPIYFTAPVLKQLEEMSRDAQEKATVLRSQLDNTAQIVRLKAREAELVNQIDIQQTQKNAKATVNTLRSELENVRKNLGDLASGQGTGPVTPTHFEMHEFNLEKMMTDGYQQAIRKISAAMQNVMVDHAVKLEDLQSTERICIAANVRDNFLANQQRTILFILNPSDLEDFRAGRIDRAGLRRKIVVKEEAKD